MKKIILLIISSIFYFQIQGMKNKINDIYTIDIKAKVEFSQDLKDLYSFLRYTDENIKNEPGEHQLLYWFVRHLVYLASKKVKIFEVFPLLILEDEDGKTSVSVFGIYDFLLAMYPKNTLMKDITSEKYTKTRENSIMPTFYWPKQNNEDRPAFLNILKIFKNYDEKTWNSLNVRYKTENEIIISVIKELPLLICPEFSKWRSELFNPPLQENRTNDFSEEKFLEKKEYHTNIKFLTVIFIVVIIISYVGYMEEMKKIKN